MTNVLLKKYAHLLGTIKKIEKIKSQFLLLSFSVTLYSGHTILRNEGVVSFCVEKSLTIGV